jgi:hypothetical protein
MNGTESGFFWWRIFSIVPKKFWEKEDSVTISLVFEKHRQKTNQKNDQNAPHESRVFIKKEFSSFGEFSQKRNCKKSPCF